MCVGGGGYAVGVDSYVGTVASDVVDGDGDFPGTVTCGADDY